MSKIESNDPNTKTLEIVAAAGQVSNVLEATKSDGTILFNIDKDGNSDRRHAQKAASYMIYRDVSTYYGIRTSNGSVVSSGSVAGTVFQATIDAMDADGGGELYIASGTYVLGVTLTFTKPKIVIRGAGPTTRLEFTGLDNTENALDFSGVEGYMRGGPTLRDFCLIGPQARAGTGRGINFYNDNALTVVMDNVRIYNFGYGIYMYFNLCSTISACYVQQCNTGIYLSGVNGTIITGTNIEYNNAGIYVWSTGILTLQGGTIEGNYGHGIELDTDVLNCTIQGIYFEANGIGSVTDHYDIYLHGVPATGHVPQNTIIQGCYFSGGSPLKPDIEIYVGGSANLTLLNNLHMTSSSTAMHIATTASITAPIFIISCKMNTIANYDTWASIIRDERARTVYNAFTVGTTQPVLTKEGGLRFWYDTANSKAYIVGRVNSTDFKVELT